MVLRLGSSLMLRRSLVFLAKPGGTVAAFAGGKGGSTKLGTDEKFTQSAFEFIFEMNRPDAPKKRVEIEEENITAMAFDRLIAAGDKEFDERLSRLIARMKDVLLSLPESLREEATLLNSEQFPANYRRATLTPPLNGYEPAFGLDVPQLRNRFDEYPKVVRPDDELAETEPRFPLVDPEEIKDLVQSNAKRLTDVHDTTRETIPATGITSEAWEAEIALNRKALARQELILQLCDDEDFAQRYNTDEDFRLAELEKRGILPLVYEVSTTEAPEGTVPAPSPPLHFSQQVKSLEPRN